MIRKSLRALLFALPNAWGRVQEFRKKRWCIAAEGVTLYPASRVLNNRRRPSAIVIGRQTKIHGTLLVLGHGGTIRIGDYVFISEGTRIWSAESITIGDRVLISHNVEIHDNNSHSLSAAERHRHFMDIVAHGHPPHLENVAAKPVVIEDDVWIGFNATILKGVTIGRGAIVGACTLVTADVPPYTIVAGAPMRTVGQSLP